MNGHPSVSVGGKGTRLGLAAGLRSRRPRRLRAPADVLLPARRDHDLRVFDAAALQRQLALPHVRQALLVLRVLLVRTCHPRELAALCPLHEALPRASDLDCGAFRSYFWRTWGPTRRPHGDPQTSRPAGTSYEMPSVICRGTPHSNAAVPCIRWTFFQVFSWVVNRMQRRLLSATCQDQSTSSERYLRRCELNPARSHQVAVCTGKSRVAARGQLSDIAVHSLGCHRAIRSSSHTIYCSLAKKNALSQTAPLTLSHGHRRTF